MRAGLQTKYVSDKTSISELLTIADALAADILAEAAATDQTDSFPAETFKKFAETGLLKTVFPKRYGGDGLGIESATTGELLNLLKTFGYGNLVVGRVYEGHFNAAQLINEYGTEKQIERLAIDAVREKQIFGVWNTEAGDGVKIFPHGDGKFRLAGAKTFATGVEYVNRPIVTGKLPDGGWQMFVVPVETVETKIDDSFWRPIGMQSSRSYRVDFTDVEITENEIVGAPDDYYRQPFFSGGAIRFAAVQLGAAELLFDLTRKFLREINRTDDAFQQMRLGEMAIAIESGNLFLKKSAEIFDDYLRDQKPEKIGKILSYAGMMRTAVEQICQDAMLRATRSIGSRGLLKPYHFERVIRDLTMYLRQAAPDATLTGIGRYVLESDAPNVHLWRNDDE
ncbi:MAG: acyl-CoA/acyl-ACP dehydrogenase [Pyrinomonadaceae bacterium]|nr:acyl-CoA/acyl-ACP dehydrogenase [Pyrinomonadaceae bacterium]